MIATVRRAWQLFDTYALARLTGRPSTAAFWYTPDHAGVRTIADVGAYRAADHPRYLIDYRPKLRYPLRNHAGITVLRYPPPIGEQVNPEAAFQVALGAHDAWFLDRDEAAKQLFLGHAEHFRAAQDTDGTWPYQFDWLANPAPWSSALAQSRGVSVMLRAARLSGERSYEDAARAAVGLFEVPIEAGGFAATWPTPSGPARYFEEYPKHPTAVLNGSMAALFGLYELDHFLGDERARHLWHVGTEGLATLLPLYDAGWWTLYDLDPAVVRRNYDSPHYHAISTTYAGVLSVLDNEHRDQFQTYHRRWRAQTTPVTIARAIVAKAHFKLTVR